MLLSLFPRDPEFSLLLLRIISLHLATAILLSPAFLDRKRRPVRNATYIAPISSILISHFSLLSILPIFSFKNENEENWRKLPRRRRRSREKDKRAFRFFRRYGGNTIARSKVCLLRARRNKGRGKRRAVEITRIPFCRSTRSSIDIYAEYPIINRHTFSNYSSTCPN